MILVEEKNNSFRLLVRDRYTLLMKKTASPSPKNPRSFPSLNPPPRQNPLLDSVQWYIQGVHKENLDTRSQIRYLSAELQKLRA